MTRNNPSTGSPAEAPLAGRSIVLVGLMGAGKTSIGRRLAARLGLPFRDADAEIELAAGLTVSELFSRFGEAAFRDGERRVVQRLLSGPPIVLATGGGAFMDAQTRAAVRRSAVCVWLRCPLPVLVQRVSGRNHRPLLADADPAERLAELARLRHPLYAEADIVIDCEGESADVTTTEVLAALTAWRAPQRLTVSLARSAYDVVVGEGLLARAGALLAPVLPQKRCVVVTDSNVASLHLPTLRAGLAEAGFTVHELVVPPGEASKSLASFADLAERVLALGIERRTAIVALGGGVVGDLAGFTAAAVLRGLPFVQVPTTLLAQVDSSVGGKTGVNSSAGKNLVGAFHQPHAVLADTTVLATLPLRELRAGYAEIAKSALIGGADASQGFGDAGFFAWCEANGASVVGGDPAAQAEAVLRACAFKAAVVGADEREEAPNDGRALLNLGHTFGHALEAEIGYSGALLHGEAVAIGMLLAFRLSARLGLCADEDAERVAAHLHAVGLAAEMRLLNRRFSAARLIDHMRRDKKTRDGALTFVLARGIGQAFTTRDVPTEAVLNLLRDEGCEA